METDLTIITVMYNGDRTRLADMMLRSVYTFTKPRPNIIVCNHGKSHKTIKKYSHKSGFSYVRHFQNPKKHSSFKHGEGLNEILPLVKTKRTAIIEPDCAVLKPNWDQIPDGYRVMACRKGTGMAGEEYYFACFMVFETEILRNMDFTGSLKDGENPIQLNPKKGYSDTGWRAFNYFKPDDVKYLKAVSCKSKNTKIFTSPDLDYKVCEYWLDDDPVAAHFWRGSRPRSRPGKGENRYVGHVNAWCKTVKGLINGN